MMERPRLSLVLSMLIFGSIGLFVRLVPLPSAAVALCRGGIGALVLFGAGALGRRRMDWSAIRRNLPLLIGAGLALGVNWILLFEAYRYTSVSVATVCYYFAPVLVALASPLLFRERLSPLRLCCVGVALAGLGLLLSGSLQDGSAAGVLLGLGAAVLYALIVLLNKFLQDIGGIERTFTQLGGSALSLLPYVLLTGGFAGFRPTPLSFSALGLLCLVHTGLAYLLYFSAVGQLPGQTVAVLSYIDPVFAVLLSALVLREPLTLLQIAGGALILGAALLSERAGVKTKAR